MLQINYTFHLFQFINIFRKLKHKLERKSEEKKEKKPGHHDHSKKKEIK